MNRLYFIQAALVSFCFILLIGCGGGSSPTVPPVDPEGATQDAGYQNDTPDPVIPMEITPRSTSESRLRDDRMYFGIWDIGIDMETHKVTVIPNRDLMMHVDVTQMLSPPNCYDCLGISVLNVDPVTHIFSIQVSLRNPTKVITGYDVRGTLLFPEGDNRELVNADGFTTIFAGGVISPFNAFAKTQPLRRFNAGETHYEQYDILFPPPANLYVTYVVDASWPANQEEVYQIGKVHLDGEINECNSGEGWLYADIYDWQSNATGIQIDLTPIGGEVVDMDHVAGHTYRTFLNNESGVAAGEYRLWFTATSENTDYDLYDFYPLEVEECDNWPPEWDDTVGIVELVSIAGGFEVVYGNATDADVPVTYNIYFSEEDPIEWTTAGYVNDVDGSPHNLIGLSDESTYWVGVRAVDALGAEEKNTVQMSGVPSNPPEWDSTVGITGVNSLDHAVEVLYGTATDPQTPVTYNVYWSDTTPIDFDTADFINDTESPTIVPDLDNFKEYYFAVRAIDAVGSEDQNTNELPCTPNGPPEWIDTVGIQSTIPGHETVTVTYGEATDIDLPIKYNIYWYETTPIDFDLANVEEDLDGSPYTVTGLINGQTYYFAVRAEDVTGDEETNTVELPGTPNAEPTWENDEIGVQSLVPFDEQVTVHYGHALDDDLPITYYIYHSTTTPIDFDTADFDITTDESPFVVTGLTNYIPYFFAVRAEDSLGIRESNTVELSTIPNPAPIWDTTVGVTSLEPGNGMITAYYGTAHDPDMPVTYRVYYSEDSPIDFGSDPYIEDAGGSPTIIPDLINGQIYYVAVRAVDSFGHEDQNTVTLSTTPMGFPGQVWSIHTGGVVQGSPALVDLDGDTILDVVIGDQANKMVAYSGVDGSAIWTFPTNGWVDSSAAIANMGGDATPDVIFGCLDKSVYCVDGATGLELWHVTTGSGIISSPTLANIKGDFHLDVIIGSMDGSLYAFDGADGSSLWSFPTGAGIFSSPANADITDDAIPDFVFGSRDGNVYAVDGNSGLEIWSFTISDWVNSSPALTDLNGDDVMDAVIAGLDGDVYAINGATGTELWSYSTGSYVWTSPALGHLNGDGVPDVVLGADSSNVYALDGATGAEIWTFPSMDRIWSSAALVDLTEDGIPEAIVGSDDGYLYAIDGTDGSLLFHYATSDWIDSSPAAGDVDGDGLVDIAFGGFDGYVTLITVEYATVGIMPWPMFRHDLEHTALF